MKTKDKIKTEIYIKFELYSCLSCPFVTVKQTPSTEYALDYFCPEKDNKKIMGHIEWENDVKPVPDWCPHRVKKGSASQ